MSALEGRIHRRLARATDALPSSTEIAELVRAADPLRPEPEVRRSVGAIEAQLHGLGPLEPLLREPGVTDVLVNGAGPVWVERQGRLQPTDVVVDLDDVHRLIERIVAPLGRRVDPAHPAVDGRLADGSRVHIVVPPLAVDGPCITIRRFAARPIELEEMATPAVADLLRRAVAGRANVVVSGATGSGKTTLLNALASELGGVERIVTVEDAAELRLRAPHVVRLESRPGDQGASIRELVRHALRMRPDRLLVGEVRGSEAFDLLAALNTGHDGSLSTVHANSAGDALDRLATLVLLADAGLPFVAVQRQLAAALDLVVHVERAGGGARAVAEVAEVIDASDSGDGIGVRSLAVGARAVATPRRRWAQP